MWLDDVFAAFHNRIALNSDRADQVRSANANLARFLRQDAPLSSAYLDHFLQGSLAINTAIRPVDESEEFDSDSVFVLDLSKRPANKRSPADVIAWIAVRLRQNPDYEGKIQERTRCVRIKYAGLFHVDLVPGRVITDVTSVLEIPSKDHGWQKSHPRGYVEWALAVDGASNGHFNQVAKIAKHWRDIRFGKESKPKSILLTTLLGLTLKQGSSVPQTLVLTLEATSHALAAHRIVPRVANPSLSEENLARDWTQDNYDVFKQKLQSAATAARRALDLATTDRERCVSEWVKLFGGKFPRYTAADGREFRAAGLSGSLFVSPLGRVTTSEPDQPSVQATPHRFYGEEDS